MGILLLVLFIGTPIAEIAVFIEAGSRFGLWPTVGAVILTAVVGTLLIRAQGLAVLRRAQHSIDRGEMPLHEVFDGLCLVVAGALLLTPGFITDAVGFALLLPFVRAGLRVWAATALARHATVQTSAHYGAHHEEHRRWEGGQETETTIIIDGDFTEVDEATRKKEDDDTPASLDHKP